MKEVRVRDFDLEWMPPWADYLSHGIEAEDFESLVIDGFEGRQGSGRPSGAAIALTRGRDVFIRNCQSEVGTETFLLLSDVAGEGMLVNNDLSRAKKVSQSTLASFTSSGNRMPRP